ncbi:MAG: four helix bundle protein, partial [Clostridia bacterium]|nr:four helix bundle protein [Clostridia bacterium]
MKEDKLGDLSMELSVEVLKLTKELRSKHETIISNQIGRSATSICANIAESKYAHSRADFIAKLEIALKETNETSKWLEMLWKSEYIDEENYKALGRKCSTIRFLLVKSITTAKDNLNAKKENVCEVLKNKNSFRMTQKQLVIFSYIKMLKLNTFNTIK